MLKLTIACGTHQATLTLFATAKKIVKSFVADFIQNLKTNIIFFTSNKLGRKKNYYPI